MTRPEDQIQRFEITPPPSANKLYRNATAKDNVKGRIKTAAYHNWRKMVAWELRLQRNGSETMLGPVSLSITLRRPHPLSDLSNIVKPTEDALQAAQIFKNDRQVSHITAAWADHDGCRITVGPDVS